MDQRWRRNHDVPYVAQTLVAQSVGVGPPVSATPFHNTGGYPPASPHPASPAVAYPHHPAVLSASHVAAWQAEITCLQQQLAAQHAAHSQAISAVQKSAIDNGAKERDFLKNRIGELEQIAKDRQSEFKRKSAE